MICATRAFSCFQASGGALEALFGSRPADDLLALAEAEAGLLHAEGLPELLEAGVDVLDLVLHRRIEPVGEPLPELLTLLESCSIVS